MTDLTQRALVTLLEVDLPRDGQGDGQGGGQDNGAGLPPPAAVHAAGRALLERLGINRPAPLPELPEDEDPEDAPEELLYWLVTMAGHSYERAAAPAPAVDEALLARLEAVLAARPAADEAHCQMPIDAASALRRAEVAFGLARRGEAPIMAIGDDDAVSLALGLMGAKDIHVADVDEGLLDFLAGAACELGFHITTHAADLFAEELPAQLSHAFEVVLTDPIRSYGPCLSFLDVSETCLARTDTARILWADHADWNFELERVLGALPALGLRVETQLPLLHRYPLAPIWLQDLPEKARALGVAPALLEGLAAQVSGYTDLFLLERIRRA